MLTVTRIGTTHNSVICQVVTGEEIHRFVVPSDALDFQEHNGEFTATVTSLEELEAFPAFGVFIETLISSTEIATIFDIALKKHSIWSLQDVTKNSKLVHMAVQEATSKFHNLLLKRAQEELN